jgi:hypothetical protein
MGVSRPTFTRIYASARQKIANAFVEGKQISIEGGKVYFDSDWYQCQSCGCYFNNPEKDIKVEACPLCGAATFINFEYSDSEKYEKCRNFSRRRSCGRERRKRHQQS